MSSAEGGFHHLTFAFDFYISMLKETIKVKWYFVARSCVRCSRCCSSATACTARRFPPTVPSSSPDHQSFLDRSSWASGPNAACSSWPATRLPLATVRRPDPFDQRHSGVSGQSGHRTSSCRPAQGRSRRLSIPKAPAAATKEITAFKPGFGLLCRRSQRPSCPPSLTAFECWPATTRFHARPHRRLVRQTALARRNRTMTSEQLAIGSPRPSARCSTTAA